jgi:phage N-6-adenine-methyltransferase
MANDTWATPQELFDEFQERYHFTLDAAADRSNAKLDRYFGAGGIVGDALSIDWPIEERIWFNPPYSRGNQRRFVERAIDCARRGGFSVGLLPADTSTRLFHDLIWKQFHVEFLPKRVRFVGAPSAAKFGSMIVEFRQ